jgi:hypothetical protein
MATSSKKPTTSPASRTTQSKKQVAKKVVAKTSASKAVIKNAAATPIKKTSAPSTMKAAPIPAKKVSFPKIEKPASKPAATRKSVVKNSVTPEERQHMIATAAYFRAEHRGFACCCEKNDWISGEAQIDAILNI